MPITWRAAPLSALSGADVYQLLQLRSTVFIVEQNSVVLDPDGLDLIDSCLHVIGTDTATGAVVAYARVLGPVVAKAARGTGLGRLVMEKAIEASTKAHPGLGCQLGAQAYLERFYNSLGFQRLAGAEPYDEHGIPHLDMKRC
ncbi:acetyltransferase [Achlya hypogyna]|uniref:Acetyltransferase n=1 Tax=Achlya hypogyna TaxID=1202772 RepID=A0A1V9YWA5_ACHHY|nr:acetyltransferase [Achlya hypogyna]